MMAIDPLWPMAPNRWLVPRPRSYCDPWALGSILTTYRAGPGNWQTRCPSPPNAALCGAAGVLATKGTTQQTARPCPPRAAIRRPHLRGTSETRGQAPIVT